MIYIYGRPVYSDLNYFTSSYVDLILLCF